MYAVAKLNEQNKNFLNSPLAGGKKAYVGLAKAIVSRLAIPTGDVEDITDYYLTNISASVRATISNINELCVVDTGYVMEIVKTLWRARVLCAYPSKATPTIFPGMCKATDVYGFGCCTTPDLESIINESAYEIMQAYAGFTKVLLEIEALPA